MSDAVTKFEPFRFAGFPLGAWAFVFRTWLAMIIALYVAFWLQLQGAASAAVCVGVLALPTRGHAIEKAAWRMFGTAVGVVASIVIVSAFNGVRELMILSFAVWLAACVYAARLLDGNRAYGAVLSGYTVAIVAIPQIDSPQNVFLGAINRGAAISIGVLAVAFVNLVFAAPRLSEAVAQKLGDTRRRVRAFAIMAIRSGAPAIEAARLLQAITAIRPEIDAVATEGWAGGQRAAAARIALSLLIRKVVTIRAVAAALDGAKNVGPRERESLAAAFETEQLPPEALRDRINVAMTVSSAAWDRHFVANGIELLQEHDREIGRAIADMAGTSGRWNAPHLPVFRSKRAALRDAIRIFCIVVLVAALLSLANWPAVSAMLATVSAFAALGGGTPDPKGFIKLACIATPVLAVVAGLTKFVLLDGADAFPLLAIAIIPMIVLGGLLVNIPHPVALLFGFLALVLGPTLMSPSNPEDYTELGFMTNALMTIGSAFLLFPALALLFPTTDEHRRRWILGSAIDECGKAFTGRTGELDAISASFRDVSRIGQLSGLKTLGAARLETDLETACALAELSFTARRSRELLPNDTEVHASIRRMDAGALRRSADRFMVSGSAEDGSARQDHLRIGLLLIWLAGLIDRSTTEVNQIRGAQS